MSSFVKKTDADSRGHINLVTSGKCGLDHTWLSNRESTRIRVVQALYEMDPSPCINALIGATGNIGLDQHDQKSTHEHPDTDWHVRCGSVDRRPWHFLTKFRFCARAPCVNGGAANLIFSLKPVAVSSAASSPTRQCDERCRSKLARRKSRYTH